MLKITFRGNVISVAQCYSETIVFKSAVTVPDMSLNNGFVFFCCMTDITEVVPISLTNA